MAAQIRYSYMPSLERVFEDLCKHLNEKMRWKDSSKKWTDVTLKFFSRSKPKHCDEIREYMNIDYIWRQKQPDYSTLDIELALENENRRRAIDDLIKEEISHLVDIKARNKIGIFNISEGDEANFIEKVREKIKAQSIRWDLERYLIITSRPGWVEKQAKKKLAVLFKGHFLDARGENEKTVERWVLQRQRI